MREAVEECPGEALGTEDLGPLVERQIGSDQDRAPLVALAEDLEEELGAGLRERHEAELVDDQKLVAGELLLDAEEPLLVPGPARRPSSPRRMRPGMTELPLSARKRTLEDGGPDFGL